MNGFHKRVLERERAKLRAVGDKLPAAIRSKDLAKVVGLALAAETIARKLIILLDNADRS